MPHPSDFEHVAYVLQALVDVDITQQEQKLKELEDQLTRLREERAALVAGQGGSHDNV
jgi:uncharacterized protein YhaN